MYSLRRFAGVVLSTALLASLGLGALFVPWAKADDYDYAHATLHVLRPGEPYQPAGGYFTPLHDSGVGGYATVKKVEGGVKVELNIKGLPETGHKYVNYIYDNRRSIEEAAVWGGVCNDDYLRRGPGSTAPVTFPLNPVVAKEDGTGSATTIIEGATLDEVVGKDTWEPTAKYFILLHAKTEKAQEGVPPAISCAELDPPEWVPDTGGGGQNPYAPVDSALDKFKNSNIAFNKPSRMQLGESETVTLLLSPSTSVKELGRQIEAEGASGPIEVSKKVLTASRMEARLTGQDFNIGANSPESQPISFKEPTRWTWDIEPTEPGEGKKIHLTINALMKVEGETTRREIVAFDRTISVHVTVQQRLAGFVGNNWQWLWTAILVPLAVWAWPRWRKGRTNREASPPPPVRQDQPPPDRPS